MLNSLYKMVFADEAGALAIICNVVIKWYECDPNSNTGEVRRSERVYYACDLDTFIRLPSPLVSFKRVEFFTRKKLLGKLLCSCCKVLLSGTEISKGNRAN